MNSKTITSVVAISPQAQDKIIDQILVQSSGVGLGIVLSVCGAVAIAYWLNLKPAIASWVEKQRVESEAIKSLSETFSDFAREYRDSAKEIKDTLDNIKDIVLKKR
ncbi:hypothetical protein [Anabaena sp. CCY 9402-a]|uniref:hypothetical protein n=1 Tax=Anabaena sp. CCY 9402-a TaxID=3103867 RepID=UPI0039C6FBA4